MLKKSWLNYIVHKIICKWAAHFGQRNHLVEEAETKMNFSVIKTVMKILKWSNTESSKEALWKQKDLTNWKDLQVQKPPHINNKALKAHIAHNLKIKMKLVRITFLKCLLL